MKCVNSMLYDIDVSICYILARQGPSDNDLYISMSCANLMVNDIDVSRCCIIARQEQSENILKVSTIYLFLIFDEPIDDEAITDTMVFST